jgi:hypothetical protein
MSSSLNEYFDNVSGQNYSIITSQTAPVIRNNLSLNNPSNNFLFTKSEALSQIELEEENNFVPLSYTQIGGVRKSYINKSKQLLKDIPQFILE